MADGPGAGGGWEQRVPNAKYTHEHIVQMSREERQQMIQRYTNTVTPVDQKTLLSTSPEDRVNSDGGDAEYDSRWAVSNGNLVVSAQRNMAKLGGLFKRKESTSQGSKEATKNTADSNETSSSAEPIDAPQRRLSTSIVRKISTGDTQGFQRLDG